MALRITTWNVNGIRNPFGYHPWSQNKSYLHMFDTLEADIVCFQEIKIQPKDLSDDMVLVPGFDPYFTFPKQKKGYSGVAIYTRKSKCTPIKAEEGITGALESLSHPGKSYRLLEPDECIGGYPDLSKEEAANLDSEGRALVLDFGAFVLIGAYCPAATDPSRDHFRACFVEALCTRVRKLVSDLKREVVVVGDLNIAREEIDACDAQESMKEAGMTHWKEALTRASLDRLLLPHPSGIMVDLCRERFPDRTGMFTCWDVKKNKRPGNAGARIDYILCSPNMRDWFGDVNIQEGLMGSDHCPVFGVIHAKVDVKGTQRSIIDVANPEGMFVDGAPNPFFKAPPLPRLCRKRFPEYSQRQSIKGMFAKMSSTSKRPNSCNVDNRPTSVKNLINPPDEDEEPVEPPPKRHQQTVCPGNTPSSMSQPKTTMKKGQIANGENKSQPGIRSFLQPLRNEISTGRAPGIDQPDASPNENTPPIRSGPVAPVWQTTQPHPTIVTQGPFVNANHSGLSTPQSISHVAYPPPPRSEQDASGGTQSQSIPQPGSAYTPAGNDAGRVDDSMQRWRAIFRKTPAPVCDMHGERCVQYLSRKAGPNEGRAFWMCSRPIGPGGESAVRSGIKNEWQCNFFKWHEREG